MPREGKYRNVEYRKVVIEIEARGDKTATRNELPDNPRGGRRDKQTDRDIEKAVRRILEKGARL